jgi:hypothetical protein
MRTRKKLWLECGLDEEKPITILNSIFPKDHQILILKKQPFIKPLKFSKGGQICITSS